MPQDNNNELYNSQASHNEFSKKRRAQSSKIIILKMYAIIGVMAAIFGLIYSLIEIYKITIPPEALMGILVSISGVLMVIAAIFGMHYIKERDAVFEKDESADMLQLMILKQWGDFEITVRKALHEDGSQPKTVPIRVMLNKLLEANIISDEDYFAIRAALDMRNRIAHGVDVGENVEQVKFVYDYLKNISKKIITEIS